MTEYEKLKSNTARTVGEVIELLKKYDPTTPVAAADSDIGGYDTSVRNYVSVTIDNPIVRFGHHEFEAYELYKNGKLTREQAEEFF